MRSTTRSVAEIGLCVALSMVLTSCAFEDGQPWGAVSFGLSATFEPASRLSPEGLLRTSKNYGVRVASLEVGFETVELTMVPEGAATDFDPSDPPPGFSLCHNGHCHAADGSLVDYEDVAIAAAEADGQAGRALQAIEREVRLVGGTVTVPVEGVCDGCALSPGQMNTVELTLNRVRFTGRIHDLLEGDARRLPEEGVEVTFSVPVDSLVRARVEGSVDKEAPVGIDVDASFVMPEEIFDGVFWAEILPETLPEGPVDVSDAPEVVGSIARILEEDAALNAAIHRFEL